MAMCPSIKTMEPVGILSWAALRFKTKLSRAFSGVCLSSFR